jgi:hypothetical protein
MLKQIWLVTLIGIALVATSMSASALCTSYPNTLTNGTTADASQVMANFNCAALTSGSTINGLTLTGTTTLPGTGVITSTGAVGIQTSSPSAALDVSSTFGTFNPTGGSIARLTNPSATGQSPLDFFINGTMRGRVRTDYVGNLNFVANGGGHYFFVGGDSGVGTQAVSISSTGSVGVGVSPSPWVSYQKGLDFGGAGNYGGLTSRAALVELGYNYYINGSAQYVYKNTGMQRIMFSRMVVTHGMWLHWVQQAHRSLGQRLWS